jgi:hypothetical protein
MEYALFLTGDICGLPTKLKLRQVSKYLNENMYLQYSIVVYKVLMKALKIMKIKQAKTKKTIMSFSKKIKNENTPLLLFC